MEYGEYKTELVKINMIFEIFFSFNIVNILFLYCERPNRDLFHDRTTSELHLSLAYQLKIILLQLQLNLLIKWEYPAILTAQLSSGFILIRPYSAYFGSTMVTAFSYWFRGSYQTKSCHCSLLESNNLPQDGRKLLFRILQLSTGADLLLKNDTKENPFFK